MTISSVRESGRDIFAYRERRLGLLDGLLDGPHHVEGLLGKVVELAAMILLKPSMVSARGTYLPGMLVNWAATWKG